MVSHAAAHGVAQPTIDMSARSQSPEIHGGTLSLIRRITDDGILTEREVWDLADYLNEDLGARSAWPGSDLFPILQDVFEDGILENHEMQTLAEVLSQIENFCAGQDATTVASPVAETVPPEAIRIEDFVLPKVEKTAKIPCKPSGEVYRVNLKNHTCDCPAWKGNRKKFPAGSIKRACVHMVDAFHQEIQEGKAQGIQDLFEHVVSDLSFRGRGIDANVDWKLLKVQVHPHLVSTGLEWCSVYARGRGVQFDRFAYNVAERRWAYGDAPHHHATIENYFLSATENAPPATGSQVIQPRPDRS